ncbi:NADP-dependent dehydrogenase [Staphylotrichum tortipilum]|uniref:NADP-dependent dehydrogenase n=1 Tax=Staphylotrichum tortipilum TaxID=2831512 RepID=A0AAN6MGE1_9PEZI|nr:NADP-dependent dehydrogenase [Staphylotrichum longicolle]
MTVYVITGTRAGLGLEYVRQLSTNPTNTIFALVRSLTGDLSALETIQSHATTRAAIHILECDLSSATSISSLPTRLFTTHAALKIDILLNNAAILHHRTTTALTMDPSTLLSHLTTNTVGPALLLQSLYPLLAPFARVVNVSSGIGSTALVASGRLGPVLTAYSVSKAALNMLTLHQARQVREGVVVVAMDPGHAKTEMGGEEAVLEVEESVKGVLGVVEGLGVGDGGRFLLYTGAEVEW